MFQVFLFFECIVLCLNRKFRMDIKTSTLTVDGSVLKTAACKYLRQPMKCPEVFLLTNQNPVLPAQKVCGWVHGHF